MKLKDKTPEEVREEYLDYKRKKQLSNPMHRDGDTAVMGARPMLSLPYWISVVLQKDDNWHWAVAKGDNESIQKFKNMFPEFSYEEKFNQYKIAHMFNDEIKATAYLYQRLKDNRIITVAVNPK